MKKTQQIRFNSLYKQYLNALLRQGKSKATIYAYYRAVRRIAAFFDCCPEKLCDADLKHMGQATLLDPHYNAKHFLSAGENP